MKNEKFSPKANPPMAEKIKKRGFTLIELLMYIAILGIVLVLITGFFWNIILGYIKENSYQELQQNGRFALTKITQEIRKAKSINIPTQGGVSDSITLEMANSQENPTIFDLDNGKLIITKGSGVSSEITTDRIVVSNLKFTNLSYDNTAGTIRIELDLEHINPANIATYKASINLITTVSLSENLIP